MADGAKGLTPAVFTFDTSPETSFKGVPALTTNAQRLRIMEAMGIQKVYLPPFEEVKNLTAEEFVEQVLIGKCNAKRIACGFNFHFGKGGKTDALTLRKLCGAFGAEVDIVPEILVDGKTVSSTQIRQLIQDGNMEEAQRFLGRPFSFFLPVEHGRKLGRSIGVPTMNQKVPVGFVEPRYGVYASVVSLHSKWYYGVTNAGVKPTVGSDYAVLETWIPGFDGDLYGQHIEVSLLKFLRAEQKFSGLEQLRQQIQQDRQTAEVWLQKNFSSHALKNLPVQKTPIYG